MTDAAVLRVAAEVVGYAGEFTSVDDDWLSAHEVTYWAGPRSLPLCHRHGTPPKARFEQRSPALT
jgi:hypothetical protein